MSYQYKIEATITLNSLGVEVISTYNALSARWEEWQREYIDTGVERSTWSRVADLLPVVADYAANDRCDFIPHGGYGALEPKSILSGNEWDILCSTANKGEEIKAFKRFIPLIATAVDMTITNEDEYVSEWLLVHGGLIEARSYSRTQEGGYGW